MSNPRQTVAAAFLFFLFTVTAASADPLRINSGFVFLGGSFGLDFGFFGAPGRNAASGFSFVGEGSGDPRFLEAAICRTCAPQRTLPVIRLTFGPTEVMDHSSNSTCPGCGYRGELVFRAGVIRFERGAPAFTSFTMTGTLPTN